MVALAVETHLSRRPATVAALTARQAADVRLFVGGDGTKIGGRRMILDGDRCFTAAWPPRSLPRCAAELTAILDSGAFTDRPEARLTPAQAFDRQLRWERAACRLWGIPEGAWRAFGLVSYDRLIDEVWVAGRRHKRRWAVADAERAVEETVEAARYLADQRERVAPRTLLLSCQGVDAAQYEACVAEVLRVATSTDWIGLGGWCILGRYTTWLPTFWATLHAVLPRIAAAGIRHVHIFGVLYQPALGGLLWLADRHGLTVSTDSSAPMLSARFTDPAKLKKAGARAPDWEQNVAWWVQRLATLRDTPFYRRPPTVPPLRQLWLFDS